MSIGYTITEADIFSEVIQPEQGDLSPELARWLLTLEFHQAAVDRMHELAERNRQDSITEAEREEMDKYMRVGSFLSLIKSKARMALRDEASP